MQALTYCPVAEICKDNQALTPACHDLRCYQAKEFESHWIGCFMIFFMCFSSGELRGMAVASCGLLLDVEDSKDDSP
jgi:hypothetical protein